MSDTQRYNLMKEKEQRIVLIYEYLVGITLAVGCFMVMAI
jgi:hypothetical protein